MSESATYKKYLLRQLGIKESQFKASTVDRDAFPGIDPEDIKKDGKKEKKEHPQLSKSDAELVAAQHLKKEKQNEGFLSPTAVKTPVIMLAVRGSSTGGLPSGADQMGQDISPDKVGGYEKVKVDPVNSKLVDKTPCNPEIGSTQPINSNPQTLGGVTHPHQVQRDSGEPPQAVTGASTEDSPLKLGSAMPHGLDIEIPEKKEPAGEEPTPGEKAEASREHLTEKKKSFCYHCKKERPCKCDKQDDEDRKLSEKDPEKYKKLFGMKIDKKEGLDETFRRHTVLMKEYLGITEKVEFDAATPTPRDEKQLRDLVMGLGTGDYISFFDPNTLEAIGITNLGGERWNVVRVDKKDREIVNKDLTRESHLDAVIDLIANSSGKYSKYFSPGRGESRGSDTLSTPTTQIPENDEEGEEKRDGICPGCSGSGEGRADGTKCQTCGGSGNSGEHWPRKRPERDPDDERDAKRDKKVEIDDCKTCGCGDPNATHDEKEPDYDDYIKKRDKQGKKDDGIPMSELDPTDKIKFKTKENVGAAEPFVTRWKMDKEKAGLTKVGKIDAPVDEDKKKTALDKQSQAVDKRFAKMEKDPKDRPFPFDKDHPELAPKAKLSYGGKHVA